MTRQDFPFKKKLYTFLDLIFCNILNTLRLQKFAYGPLVQRELQVPSFRILNVSAKLIWLMTCEDGIVIHALADRFKPPSIFILTVPKRYFCCGSLLLLVLAVRIYTLVQLLC